MIERLSGRRKYNDDRTNITPLDIDEARKPDRPTYPVRGSDLTKTKHSELLLDEYGMVWDHEPPTLQKDRAIIFSPLDIMKGFFQQLIAEEDQSETAFVSPERGQEMLAVATI